MNLNRGTSSTSWTLTVTDSIAGATGTLHGGCGLAAAAAALELATGREIAYISGQFLARAPVESEVVLEVEESVVGNKITQAAVTCRLGDIMVLRAAAALGGHELNMDRQWLTAPSVPGPESCPKRGPTSLSGRSFNDFADIRVASQQPGDRVVCYWARLEGTLASTRQGLIALADLLPSGMRVSLDTGFRGSSLDHSVRLVASEKSEWVLLCIQSAAVQHSVGHGNVEIYSQSGTLLALGSQSFAISSITGALDR
ncbi:MAG: thioesterase family protein [Acidimicrobiales bacterium]|nr:thioesterase family protein [Acidimicrobiales bacterium]